MLFPSRNETEPRFLRTPNTEIKVTFPNKRASYRRQVLRLMNSVKEHYEAALRLLLEKAGAGLEVQHVREMLQLLQEVRRPDHFNY
ncbi:hypothetical protein L596_005406 [Steinernema carpocapsae]|uniref:Uncharacterized protein n=1 Tax=Steinernema carpocapsae TaxID=34508 RepID=A0A4U8V0D2_STECR|nr:hypothetical protein L596_005406 [Steinernema carpocapsae]